jgi:hypothetical protein
MSLYMPNNVFLIVCYYYINYIRKHDGKNLVEVENHFLECHVSTILV